MHHSSVIHILVPLPVWSQMPQVCCCWSCASILYQWSVVFACIFLKCTEASRSMLQYKWLWTSCHIKHFLHFLEAHWVLYSHGPQALNVCLLTKSDRHYAHTPGHDFPIHYWCTLYARFTEWGSRRSVFDSLHGMSHLCNRATELFCMARNHHRCVEMGSAMVSKCPRLRYLIIPSLHKKRSLHHMSSAHRSSWSPTINGCVYSLTCIDRFTRWPEAIPIQDAIADTVVQAFIQTSIANFGVSSSVTTNRGRQFVSLRKTLSQLLGTRRIQSTAYHPIAYGLVEGSIASWMLHLRLPPTWINGLRCSQCFC